MERVVLKIIGNDNKEEEIILQMETDDEKSLNEKGINLKMIAETDVIKKEVKNDRRLKKRLENKNEIKKECKICKKEFPSLKLINEHYKEHDDQHFCDICNAGFKQILDKILHKIEHSNDANYRCEMCDYKSPNKKEIIHHVEEHMKKKIKTNHDNISPDKNGFFNCIKCNFKTTFSKTIKKHLNECLDKLVCKFCDKEFAIKSHLRVHQINIHRFEMQGVDAVKNYHECNICGKNFQYKYKLKIHIDMVHNTVVNEENHKLFTDFVCYICRGDTMTGKQLMVHFYKEHPDITTVFKRQHELLTEIHGCEICKIEFTSLKLLNQHLDDHEDEHFCEECNQGFKLIFDKIIHMLQHSSDDNYACLYCDYKNTNKIEIKNHLNRHLETSLVYKCNQCDKRYSLVNSLKDHIKVVHDKEKPFNCEFCGKTFALKRHLNVHQINVHRNNKTHTCHICGKNFTYNYKLKYHIKTVHEKHQIICEVCGKVLYHKRTILNHMKIHKGEKKFQCQYCEMKFISSTGLKGHERLHTGEKPYKCNLCDESFPSSGRRNFHQLRHTNPTPFQCKYCEKKFASKSGFRKHVSQCEWEHAHKVSSLKK